MKDKRNVNEWTRKELEALPYRKKWNETITCGSVVILPLRGLHGSGYRLMDFIAVDRHGVPICKLSGCSDVLHIEDIGGFGYEWSSRYDSVPQTVPATGWSFDCLPKSGLLRLFCDKDIVCEAALSSFSVCSKPKESDER